MIQLPPEKTMAFEECKPDLIRAVGSMAGLPSLITPEWIQQLVDSSADTEGVFSRLEQSYTFSKAFGRLYHNATFTHFEANSDDQKRVVAQIKEISEFLHEPKTLQRNLIFFGPCGTGKDHMMYCLLMKAIFVHGYRVQWFDGSALFGKLRHAAVAGSIEQKIEQLQSVDILAISDPLFISDELTPFLIEQWGRIVDYRYRHCLPIWLTVNAKDRSVFKKHFSNRTAGRLLQNARSVLFNETDYRERKEKQR